VRAAGVLAKGCMFDMPELEDELQNKNKTSWGKFLALNVII
jgi:hypothetical protein